MRTLRACLLSLCSALSLFGAAIMAKVTGRATAGGKNGPRDEVRFNLQVQSVFKTSNPLLTVSQRKSTMGLLVPAKNLDCRCPNIKINK